VTVLLNAISDAAVLAPLAVGISVIYRMSGVINFAAGAVAVSAAYIAVEIGDGGALGVIAALLAGTLIGVLLYVTTVLPGKALGAPPVAMTLATFGFAVVLEAVGHRVFGGLSRAADPWLDGSIELVGTTVTHQRMLVIGIGLAITVVIIGLFDRTMIGRIMEACAANEPLARLYGSNTGRYHLLAWAIGGLGAAATGVLQVAIAGVSVALSLHLLLVALVAGVVGGIRGLRSTALGVVLVALLGSVVARYITTAYVLTPIFLLLLIGLYLRPQGVFVSTKTADRV
jgi:branched-subunit amino acid ABC-type transport system permease component